MAYVVQQPNSNTNPTDKHRVVDFFEWLDFTARRINHLPIRAEYANYDEAATERDRLNRETPQV